jgi:hypothetical protein
MAWQRTSLVKTKRGRQGPLRLYLFGLLRLPGEENEFRIEDRVSSRLHILPLMPLARWLTFRQISRHRVGRLGAMRVGR